MKDSNIYPFKGWWPKANFIICQVKEDPNVEIDKNALINEFATSKRTKKSRFNDDTSLIDIRPTVPSKWDSDYDGSPAIDKVMEVEVSQNSEIIISNDVGIIIKPENNPPDMSCQDEESMDTMSDVGEVEPKVISTSPNLSQEAKVHAVLNTEYEEFLKIVSVEKSVENSLLNSSITNEVKNNLSVKSSTSLNGDSVEDSSTKSSDEFVSFHGAEEINDKSFVNRLSSVETKLKKKKTSSKKSKKFKKKKNKKMKRKSSSSESSQDSESESDSSSEDSDSETTHSTSSVEKKKYKSKDRKNKKSKTNKKKKKFKKSFSDLLKTSNLSLEGFTKKYLNERFTTYEGSDAFKKKKNNKSKKSFKRKHESDISGEEITPKKSRLDASLKIKDCEKKKSKKKKSSEKRSIDSEEHVSKKKSKKKSKTADSSETDDGEEFEHKKMKNEKDHFFGQRPNEWNMKTKSSMRGVAHHSDVKNINSTSTTNDISGFDEEVAVKRSFNLNNENSCPSDVEKKQNEILGSLNVLIEQFEQRKKNSESESEEQNEYNIEYDKKLIKPDECDDNVFKRRDVLQNTTLSLYDDIDDQVLNKSLNNVPKQIQNKSHVTNTIIQPIGETVSYRDKVKMNLKKLSTCQHIPFVFGFSSPLTLIKPTNLKLEKMKPNFKETNEHLKPVIDESTFLKFDKQKVVIRPQTQKKKTYVTNIVPPTIIGMDTNHKLFDSSVSGEVSEESVPNCWEYLSDERQNEQLEPSFLKNKLLINYNDNQLCKNDLLSNSIVIKKKEHSFDTTESSSCGSNTENQNEKAYAFENIVAEGKITTSSNSTDVGKFKLRLESNNIVSQNTNLVQMKSVIKDSDSICSPSSNIDLEASIIDNELIVQWTSDWSKLNTSVTDNNSNTHQIDDQTELQLKKSRWDEPPKYDEVDPPKSLINGQNEVKDIFNSLTTDNLENTNVQPKEELISEEQMCEINSVVDETRNYSENWTNEYTDDCSQYEECSFTPQYSKMKTIEKDKLIPVDYSVYENYNPNYNCYDEDYNKWKSLDTSNQCESLAITSETLSSIQVSFKYITIIYV